MSRGLSPESLFNSSFGFFGATQEPFGHSDVAMGNGQISVKRQRPLALGDPLRGSKIENVCKAQTHVPQRMVGCEGKRSGRKRFPGYQARGPIFGSVNVGEDAIHPCNGDKRLYVACVGSRAPLEIILGSRHVVRGKSPVEPRHALKIKVHRVRPWRALGTAGLRRNELGIERIGEPSDDLILHIEKVVHRLVESLGPKMIAGFGVDQLNIDPHTVAPALDTSLEHIADVEFATDLPQIARPTLKRKRRVAPNYKHAGEARERSVVRLSVTPSTKYS